MDPGKFATTGLRVLLVGDDPMSVEPLKSALREACKHEVTICTGVSARSSLLLQKTKCNIVLAEYRMGDLGDGLQLLDSIRSTKKLDNLPVVFVFSGDQEIDVDALKRMILSL